jgi:hypothetical protein
MQCRPAPLGSSWPRPALAAPTAFKFDNRWSKTARAYKKKPQTPYQRSLETPDIVEATKTNLCEPHGLLNPSELTKALGKDQKILTAPASLNRESIETKRACSPILQPEQFPKIALAVLREQ